MAGATSPAHLCLHTAVHPRQAFPLHTRFRFQLDSGFRVQGAGCRVQNSGSGEVGARQQKIHCYLKVNRGLPLLRDVPTLGFCLGEQRF